MVDHRVQQMWHHCGGGRGQWQAAAKAAGRSHTGWQEAKTRERHRRSVVRGGQKPTEWERSSGRRRRQLAAHWLTGSCAAATGSDTVAVLLMLHSCHFINSFFYSFVVLHHHASFCIGLDNESILNPNPISVKTMFLKKEKIGKSIFLSNAAAPLARLPSPCQTSLSFTVFACIFGHQWHFTGNTC